MSKLNDEPMPYIRSLHSRNPPFIRVELPQCGTPIFSLVCVEPKGMTSCGAATNQGVVRWAESGGWFNEGPNVLPRMSDTWSLPYLLFCRCCLECLC